MFVIFKLFCLFSFIIHNKCEKDEQSPHIGHQGNEENHNLVEYIVLFKNYYGQQTRENYITTILKANNITSNFHFTERTQLSTSYPSDFELITCQDNVLDILQLHPAIKLVQKNVALKLNLNAEHHRNHNFSMYHRVALPKSAVVSSQISDMLQARKLWERGITGKGVKVAVFDTGLPRKHPHFRNVKERTDWTNEKSLNDGVSHGTFVTGVIASSKECLGLAPDAELHIFRVFTSNQVSYTSWFLDAFNYAMFKKINILNLSIGGPDWMDQPFVDKVLELSANRVIVVSAIGNDGPLYGTLNNPGDQNDVIGVGCINPDDMVSKFSSRGMTTWELPRGYGRIKPDIVTYGSDVKGSDVNGGCRSLSGTSVAAPVVTGAVALILSGAADLIEKTNQAMIKQVLTEGAERLPSANVFEQGYGKLNILQSMKLLNNYKPKITLSPPYVDHSEGFMWPFNSQPLYCQAMPLMLNATIWNAFSVRGEIKKIPIWYPDLANKGDMLDVKISYSRIVWPWSGWMSLKIFVNDKGCLYEGEAKGHVQLVVEVWPVGEKPQNVTVVLPVSLQITPKPPRHKRILWDQYHNLQYPPGYIPRDNLKTKSDRLDWRGDHLHTNFRDMYLHLRSLGYYLEVLGMPFTCYDARDYGVLMIVDPEEEFFDEEIYKLQRDVFDYGLSVIVFADWYNTTVMKKMRFFDENTREWWIPDTGGANIPALNDLLSGFGVAFGDTIAEGYYQLGEHEVYYASGSILHEFPKNNENIVISALLNDQGREVLNNMTVNKQELPKVKHKLPIIGLFQLQLEDRKEIIISKEFEKHNVDEEKAMENAETEKWQILNKRVLLNLEKEEDKHDKEDVKETQFNEILKQKIIDKSPIGRLAVMGDSNCIDSSAASEKSCMWLLNIFLEFTMHGHTAPLLKELNGMEKFMTETIMPSKEKPKRLKSSKLHTFSKVMERHKKGMKRPLENCEQRRRRR